MILSHPDKLLKNAKSRIESFLHSNKQPVTRVGPSVMNRLCNKGRQPEVKPFLLMMSK